MQNSPYNDQSGSTGFVYFTNEKTPPKQSPNSDFLGFSDSPTGQSSSSDDAPNSRRSKFHRNNWRFYLSPNGENPNGRGLGNGWSPRGRGNNRSPRGNPRSPRGNVQSPRGGGNGWNSNESWNSDRRNDWSSNNGEMLNESGNFSPNKGGNLWSPNKSGNVWNGKGNWSPKGTGNWNSNGTRNWNSNGMGNWNSNETGNWLPNCSGNWSPSNNFNTPTSERGGGQHRGSGSKRAKWSRSLTFNKKAFIHPSFTENPWAELERHMGLSTGENVLESPS